MDFPPRFYNEFHRFFDGQAKWSESFHKVRCRANRNGNSHRIGANSSRDRRAKIDRLSLSPKAPLLCGVLIQRGCLRVILSDLCGKIKTDCAYRFHGLISPDLFQEKLGTLCRDCLSKAEKPVLAAGISCAGPVNTTEGTLLNPHHFFTEPFCFPICRFVEEQTGLRCFLCNDATAGSNCGKVWFGKGREEENFVYISAYNGIGAGSTWKTGSTTAKQARVGSWGTCRSILQDQSVPAATTAVWSSMPVSRPF